MTLTVKQSQSIAAKKAWRSRKRLAAARDTVATDVQPRRRRVGYGAILAATTPEKSSAVIADELGVTAAYVRKVWQRHGLEPRPIGKRPLLCASSQGPTHERT